MKNKNNYIAELKTYDSQKSLIFENWKYDDEYFCFDIYVLSGDFSGKQMFCISRNSFEKFLRNLKNLIEQLTGSIELREEYETDHFIKMELDHLGHLSVIGELFYHAPLDQQLIFGFVTDQTCLQPLYDDLSNIINQE
jgi:hypothetical protein